jgi:predicted  nucleic acid-binding Zn-ribbon protein
VNKNEELDRLKRAIMDSEIRLKSVQSNIEQIDKEIDVLRPRQAELERNIEFHKKSNTVPLAQEYKKAKVELSKTKARLILITSDRKKSDDACKQIQQVIEKLKRDHLDLIATSDNNVLRVLFGAKRGKK